MRKGTKGIRKVFTGTNEYYVYDLDENIFGKRKRLYAKTEGELKEKIEEAEQERNLSLALYKPKTKILSDYVRYYFKNAVGNIPSRDIKRLIILFERSVFESEIDKDIDTITEAELQNFYDDLIEKFPLESVKDIDRVLRKTFKLSNKEGLTSFDFKKIKLPKNNVSSVNVSYILNPEEFESMLSFCIADNCTRYGKNQLLIIFSMMTGLKLSSIKKLTPKDFDLEKKLVFTENRFFPLSEKCVLWLKQQVSNNFISLANDNIDDKINTENKFIGITRYTSSENNPVFINSNGTSPTLQSVQSTISSIAKRCGLPKGITGKTLCKSYIISELENGATIEQLCERFRYKNRRSITDIQDEYEIRKTLF